MHLRRQPNPWSCLATAFAMLMEVDPEDIFAKIGHDGSEEKNGVRRGFHIQEIIRLAHDLEVYLTPFEFQPVGQSNGVMFTDYGDHCDFVLKVMQENEGILLGMGVHSGELHAVGWDRGKVYDPNGMIYDFEIMEEHFLPSVFFRAII